MDYRLIPVGDKVVFKFLEEAKALFYEEYKKIHFTDEFWKVRDSLNEWLETVQTTSNIEEIFHDANIVSNYIRSEENCIAYLNVIIYDVCKRYVSEPKCIDQYNCLITKYADIIVKKYVSEWKEAMKERSGVFFKIKWSYYEKTYLQLEKLRLEKQKADREAKVQKRMIKRQRRKARAEARAKARAEARAEVENCMQDIISKVEQDK